MGKIHIVIYGIKTEPANMSCSCTSGCDCDGACSPSLTQADDFKNLEESFIAAGMNDRVALEFRDMTEINVALYPQVLSLVGKDRTLLPITEVDGKISFYSGIKKDALHLLVGRILAKKQQGKE
jgi:hypothetical protein